MLPAVVHLELESSVGLDSPIICNVQALRGFARLKTGRFRLFYLSISMENTLTVETSKRFDVRTEDSARTWTFPPTPPPVNAFRPDALRSRLR